MRLYFLLEDCDSSLYNKAVFEVSNIPFEEDCYYADVEGEFSVDVDSLIPYNTTEFVDWGILTESGEFIADPDDAPEDAKWGSLYLLYEEGKCLGLYFDEDDTGEELIPVGDAD